jgi:hypothetical protein
MSFHLACETCDFVHETDDEIDAYAAARDHESEHPTHYVFIEEGG